MIYFIRHARSIYNIKQSQLFQKHKKQNPNQQFEKTPSYLQLKFDVANQDCDTFKELALKQCENCKQKMKNIPLDLIIVSPMRRALTTCALVFNNHQSQAPVIVDPIFRQILQSYCDIGSRLRESMKDYPNFDYSLIDNIDYWYIQTLCDQKQKKQLLSKLANIDPSKLNEVAKNITAEYLKDLWKKREILPELKSQALSSITQQKAKLKLLMKQYKSIAIVTHSQNIKSYIGTKPQNCSILLYKSEYLDKPIEQIPKNFL